jgi:hypothetical protein
LAHREKFRGRYFRGKRWILSGRRALASRRETGYSRRFGNGNGYGYGGVMAWIGRIGARSDHSYRRATTGSFRAARRAGITLAMPLASTVGRMMSARSKGVNRTGIRSM